MSPLHTQIIDRAFCRAYKALFAALSEEKPVQLPVPGRTFRGHWVENILFGVEVLCICDTGDQFLLLWLSEAQNHIDAKPGDDIRITFDAEPQNIPNPQFTIDNVDL